MSQEIYCAVRKEWIKALPEEIVRQKMINYLIQQQFPLEAMVVEKGLWQLPHLQLSKIKIPTRRADIICFAKGIHPEYSLYPLLLVECKAPTLKLTSKMINQVTGYNYYLNAPFLALTNGEELRFGWFDNLQKDYKFIDYLPSYAELLLHSRREMNPQEK